VKIATFAKPKNVIGQTKKQIQHFNLVTMIKQQNESTDL
jgi:hypothetical protein